MNRSRAPSLPWQQQGSHTVTLLALPTRPHLCRTSLIWWSYSCSTTVLEAWSCNTIRGIVELKSDHCRRVLGVRLSWREMWSERFLPAYLVRSMTWVSAVYGHHGWSIVEGDCSVVRIESRGSLVHCGVRVGAAIGGDWWASNCILRAQLVFFHVRLLTSVVARVSYRSGLSSRRVS